jgi:hypothetical protein
MIVIGEFAGPVAGESPMGTENRFSSAKTDTDMSVTIMMKKSFLISSSPLASSRRLVIHRQSPFRKKILLNLTTTQENHGLFLSLQVGLSSGRTVQEPHVQVAVVAKSI